MHAMAGLVDKSGLENKSFDALASYELVADASVYLSMTQLCRRRKS